MGFPMMSAKALPSKRVEAYLAGITAVIFMWRLNEDSDRNCRREVLVAVVVW
jgi:hypothetical protein